MKIVSKGTRFQMQTKPQMLDEIILEGNDFLANRTNLAKHFEDVFQRLLDRENVDLNQEELSFIFEVMAFNLFAQLPERKDICFDGVDDLSATIRKPKQVEFRGKMWILENQSSFSEPFQARITDKRITKQGVWITMWVGSDKAEGDLSLAFGLSECNLSGVINAAF